METKIWPRLYDQSKTGKIKTWEIETTGATIKITWGVLGGNLQTREKVIRRGKNVGKRNETSPESQAMAESQAKWQKQIDKGYVDSQAKIGIVKTYYPMLAKTYYHANSPDVLSGKKKATKLPNHILIQKKLNGVRCPAVKEDSKVTLWSRNMKDYTPILQDLADHMNEIMNEGEIWDGEIYVHGWSFQRIISAVKQDKSKVWRKKVLFHCKKKEWTEAKWWVKTRNDTQRLEYHRYDIPSINAPMKDRWIALTYAKCSDRVKPVTTIKVNGDLHDGIKHYHDEFIKDGYEGIIIRDYMAKYLWKHRGAELLKYKEFIDAEFRIVGYKEGSDGGVTFKLRTGGSRSNGGILRYKYFDCRPIGTMEHRRDLYQNGWRYAGKMLTVRFQEYSDDNVPIFPVGIAFRDYE